MRNGMMSKMLGCLALVTATMPGWSGSMSGDSHRCGNDIVQIGDSKYAVQAACGEPSFKDSHCRRETVELRKDDEKELESVCVTVDEWTYDFGSGQLLTTFQFEEGKLTAIIDGGRTN